MSAISTAYDALKTRIEAKLLPSSGWLKIPNPYEMENNSDGVLRQGYGIKIMDATSVQAITCNYHIDRTFGIVISRECMNTDHDADGIATVEKQIMEDLVLLIADFELNTTLNTGLIFCGYLGDGGIQLIRRQQAYLYLEAQFKVKIVANLT